MKSPRSRYYSVGESLALGFEEAKFQGIQLKLKQLTIFDSAHFSTFLCSSNDTKLKMSFIGGGSGTDPIGAKVKAVYESIEWNLQHRITGLVSADTDWTGLGTGATPEEAIIHGISEWIERDGYGLFLMRA